MQDSRIDRYEIFIAAAIIAAEAEHGDSGFRHRDILFMINLFTNWVETSLDGSVLSIQNSQLARYMNRLVEENLAKRLNKKDHPKYKLTRVGLIELISKVVQYNFTSDPTRFFFVYYFISSYSSRVLKMIENKKDKFPTALRIECEELFSIKALVEREIKNVQKELKKTQVRINDSFYASKTVSEYLASGKSLQSAISEISQVAPYDLDSQKPLAELISEIPQDLREWELTKGNETRANFIFKPTYHLLNAYLIELEKLLTTSN